MSNINIEYNKNPINRLFLLFTRGDPNMLSKIHQAEVMNEYEKHNPEKYPEKDPGDIYITFFTIIGAFLGCILGSFGNNLVLFASIAGGVIIGAAAGYLIRKWRRKKRG